MLGSRGRPRGSGSGSARGGTQPRLWKKQKEIDELKSKLNYYSLKKAREFRSRAGALPIQFRARVN